METEPKPYEGHVRISANAGKGPVLSPKTRPHYVLTTPDRNFYDRAYCRDADNLHEEDRIKLEELLELSRLAVSDEELSQPAGRQYILASKHHQGEATEVFGAGPGSLSMTELVVRENDGVEHSYFCLEYQATDPKTVFKLMYTADGGICDQEVTGIVPAGRYINPFDRAINLVQQVT